MPAPREVPAQLWINGQPRGIFEIEEVWGKEALASRFADATGPLYRLRGLTNTDRTRTRAPTPPSTCRCPGIRRGCPIRRRTR